ncbi:hypothetical protein BC831DRAFT_456722 [Entophlyctis helioformis]|nr:hypothetical protein BC831DRAFT_456722 [Entophlyctis helioformis]
MTAARLLFTSCIPWISSSSPWKPVAWPRGIHAGKESIGPALLGGVLCDFWWHSHGNEVLSFKVRPIQAVMVCQQPSGCKAPDCL